LAALAVLVLAPIICPGVGADFGARHLRIAKADAAI
jgi:hypothetical protein